MRRTCKRRTEVDFQQRVNSEIPLNSLTFETFATEEILHVCFLYVFVFLSLSKLLNFLQSFGEIKLIDFLCLTVFTHSL